MGTKRPHVVFLLVLVLVLAKHRFAVVIKRDVGGHREMSVASSLGENREGSNIFFFFFFFFFFFLARTVQVFIFCDSELLPSIVGLCIQGQAACSDTFVGLECP